jgi:hypothetical protein
MSAFFSAAVARLQFYVSLRLSSVHHSPPSAGAPRSIAISAARNAEVKGEQVAGGRAVPFASVLDANDGQ